MQSISILHKDESCGTRYYFLSVGKVDFIRDKEHFTELAKLNFLKWFNFILKPIYTTAQATFKNDAQLKLVKID
jgi:hypothetical protein